MAHKSPTTGEAQLEQASALDKHLAKFDAPALEDEIQAYSFCQEKLREFEATERVDNVQRATTETLQVVVAAPTAGALAAYRTKKGVPVGAYVNGALGLVAKILAYTKTDNRAVRVAADVGKVFLHSQLSMMTKEAFED